MTEETARRIAFSLISEPEVAGYDIDTLTRALMVLAERWRQAGWRIRIEREEESRTGAAPAAERGTGLYRQ